MIHNHLIKRNKTKTNHFFSEILSKCILFPCKRYLPYYQTLIDFNLVFVRQVEKYKKITTILRRSVRNCTPLAEFGK